MLENGRVEIGKHCGAAAKSVRYSSAIIMFPEYESKEIGSAA